jgi:hypothetical protein
VFPGGLSNKHHVDKGCFSPILEFFFGGQSSAINLLIPKQFRGEKEIAGSITQSLKVYLRDDLLFFGEQDICGRQIRDQ